MGINAFEICATRVHVASTHLLTASRSLPSASWCRESLYAEGSPSVASIVMMPEPSGLTDNSLVHPFLTPAAIDIPAQNLLWYREATRFRTIGHMQH